MALGTTDASAADSVVLKITGSQPGIDYRVEYDTGPVRAKSSASGKDADDSYADGRVDEPSDSDGYTVPSDATADRIVVENTGDNSATFELEHTDPRRISPRVDGDAFVESPNDTETRYELHTVPGGRARVYSSDTEIFQDEVKQSARYKAGQKGVGTIIDKMDRWDFEGQFRFVVLDLDPGAKFELTRDLF